MSNIKILLFDAAGVLFEANKVVGEDIEATFGLTEEQQAPMWKGVYKELSAGRLSPEQFFDETSKILSIDRALVNEDLFTRSFIKALKPIEGMAELLDELSKNNQYILALLSDTTPIHNVIRSKEGYYKYFKKAFLSFEIGFCKPDPRAFQTVIDYFNVLPEEIFFVDDNINNVEGARRLGLKAEQFTSVENLKKQLIDLGIIL